MASGDPRIGWILDYHRVDWDLVVLDLVPPSAWHWVWVILRASLLDFQGRKRVWSLAKLAEPVVEPEVEVEVLG